MRRRDPYRVRDLSRPQRAMLLAALESSPTPYVVRDSHAAICASCLVARGFVEFQVFFRYWGERGEVTLTPSGAAAARRLAQNLANRGT